MCNKMVVVKCGCNKMCSGTVKFGYGSVVTCHGYSVFVYVFMVRLKWLWLNVVVINFVFASTIEFMVCY